MSYILAKIILTYFTFFAMNELIGYRIMNQVEDLMDSFLEEENIILDLYSRKELIMSALIREFINEITTERWLDYIPFVALPINIYNLWRLKGEMEEFIFYLKQCYPDVLYSSCSNEEIINKKEKNINGKEETIKATEEKNYFLTYQKDGKYVTFWFTYLNGQFQISYASKPFQQLSEKEQLTTLYQILKELRAGNKKDYHYSNDIQELLKPEILDNLDEEMARKRVLNEC